jgi:hypothetical protein
MAQTTKKVEVNLKGSVNTDSISQDTYQFEDQNAPLLLNTGIERNGGIRSLYQTEVTLPANGSSYIAPSGDLVSKLESGDVLINETTIGNVSPYGIQIRDSIVNVDDVILSTAAKTYITATFANKTVTISEYYTAGQQIVTENIPSTPLLPGPALFPAVDLVPAGVQGAPIHQRSITFPSLSTSLYTSLSFVRTSVVNWNDTFKFALRQGDNVTILQEYVPGVTLIIPGMLSTYDELNYLYVYQYENLSYFVCLIGNANNQAFITNNDFSAIISTFYCKYPVAQVSGGKSRHLITCDPKLAATQVFSIGYVGYYNFSIFTTSVNWVGQSNTGATQGYYQPLAFNTGYGYSEFTQKDGSGNYWNFNSPSFDYNSSVQYGYHKTQNTSLLYNYYGKFTNIYTLAPSVPFEFRVCWIAGTQAYLSVASYDDSPGDYLGTCITEIGNFDDTYAPMTAYDNTILYKYNSNYYIIVVDQAVNAPTSIIPEIQQISPFAFKLNTISPLNIVDLQTHTLLIGSCDYNGRMSYSSTASPGSVTTRIVSSYNGKYSNGVDTGEVFTEISSPTSDNIEVIGYRVDGLQSFLIDTYIAPPSAPASTPVYAFSTTSTGAQLSDPNRSDTLYIQNSVLPFALGDLYNLNVANTLESTIFYNTTGPLSVGTAVVAGTSIGYDGYTLGNDIPGQYVSFRLQGQQYIQDASWIYKVNIQNNIYQNKDQFAPAIGVKYIASSPTVVYFLSTFDNSIYTFTGGTVLSKAKRMNSCDRILSGMYSVKDDTLLLNATNSFIWMRDGVVTINTKTARQTGAISLFETVDGAVIANANYRWLYTYNNPTITPTPNNTSYTVVPLYVKTAFFGLESNQRVIVPEWIISVYSEDKTKTSLILNNYVEDLDGGLRDEQRYININPQDYTEGGYSRVTFRPQYQANLRSSIALSTAEFIQIQSIVVTYQDGADAPTSARRTR